MGGKDVHSVNGTRFAGLYVSNAFEIRNVFPPNGRKSRRNGAHHFNCNWLQNEAVGVGVGTLAFGVKRLLEPILDDSVLSPNERLSQVRLLPDSVGHRGPSARRRPRTRQ